MRIGVAALVLVAALVSLSSSSIAVDVDDDQHDDHADTQPESTSIFPKGTWTLELQSIYVNSVRHHDDAVTNIAFGAGYYFDERHAIRGEIVGSYLDNDDDRGPGTDDAIAAGVNLGLRYHFLEHGGFTLFVEGLGGVIYGDHKFPAGGTRFNFSAQLGLGATLRLDEHLHLIGGARYEHISNAQISGQDENPTFDGVGGYVGLLFTY